MFVNDLTKFRDVYFVLKMLVLLLIMASTLSIMGVTSSQWDFNCNSTTNASLVVYPSCKLRGKHSSVFCSYRLKPFNTHYGSSVQLNYQKEVAELSNSTYVTMCLGMTLQKWEHQPNSVQIFFNPDLTVGYVQLYRSCLYKSFCHFFSVRVRSDIMTLPTMNLAPDIKSFWNFTSAVFGLRFKWMRRFQMSDELGGSTANDVVNALSGTSVSEIHLRGPSRRKSWKLPTFINMSELQVLVLSNGYSFSEECFRHIARIRILRLNNDQITHLPTCVYRLEHLEELTLIQNNIKSLSKVFDQLLNVKVLKLGYNAIRTLPTVFPYLPNILNLNLDFCGIIAINAHAFKGLTNLQILSLTGNNIMNFDAMAFRFLPKLDVLWLNHCNLYKWPIEALRGLKLKELHMKNNLLTELSDLGATGTFLQYLDVSSNSILSWDDGGLFLCRDNSQTKHPNGLIKSDDTCLNGTWVMELKIQRNGIRTLTEPMRKSLDSLRKVDLTGNKIDCADCNTPLVQQWLRKTHVKVQDPFLCSEPLDDKDRRITEITFDPTACLGPYRKMMSIVIPVTVVTAVVVVTALGLYVYRTEIAYLQHLIRIRHTTKSKGSDPQEYLYDAFICYSGKNRKFVLQRLAPLLERGPDRLRLCMYDRDFRLGSQIVNNIVEAIDRSTKVLVVLSEHFISSKWCGWELEMANHKLFSEDRSFLVLLELEPLRRERLPRLLRFLLDTRPLVRWPRPETAAAVAAAVGQLRRALGPGLAARATCDPTLSHASASPPSAASVDERSPLLALGV